MAKKGIRDLLLFFAFAGVPIVSFWLQDYPDTPFYAGMLVIFLIVLVWLRSYHKESEHARLVDYDENLHLESFMWIGLGILGTYIVSSVIVQKFAETSIWVPIHELEMTFGNLQLTGFWNATLFQLVLVAASEELCKLVCHLAFYMKLKDGFSEGMARAVSVGAPIFFWAMLHVYRAYTGPGMYTMLAAAFAGGLIIYAVMYKTRSLLAAILTHAGYNCLIIYMSTVIT